MFDVLVGGGGVVGLTAAIAMAERGYSVAVIDAGSLSVDLEKIDLRVYALNKASQMLLEQLGVWSTLEMARASPYQRMHVWDAANGASIDFDCRTIAAARLGTIVEESVLKKALLTKALAYSQITLFPHCAIDNVLTLERGISIFSQEKSWTGGLLMVADGANSPLRQKLHVEMTTWPYQQQALVAMVNTQKPHHQTAYQVFNAEGPLAFLPLSHPHQCSIVWSTNKAQANDLVHCNDDVFNERLTTAFAAKLGQTKLLSARYQYPLQMRHVKQYSGACWLLMGDAAHTIHPLAGLGLNVGLADVTTWLKHLDANTHVLTTKKVLHAYQRERKHAVWQTILLMEGFKQLFSQSLKPVTWARGIGLQLCNQLTPVKRLFIEHATGL